MKIARATIENFRHIAKLDLDFTDSLGRVRDLALIVGPNTSGKTTILDALAACVGIGTELPFGRADFQLTPRVVRKGALYSKVTCEVLFSPEEISATREIIRLGEEKQSAPNEAVSVTVEWIYPDPDDKAKVGVSHYTPANAKSLFKARAKVTRLLRTGRVDWRWFERVGGVFTFDQQRSGISKIISPDIWAVLNKTQTGNRRTSDPRTILLAAAIKSQFASTNKNQPDEFALIRQRYAEVCAPRRIVGAVRDELDEFDLVFANDGQGEYRYEGLSSGEQMLLLFLIQMVTNHIHRSIIFIDELELHQHPIWQRRLLSMLPSLGKDNQIIATTHSPYLREAVAPEAVIELGNL